MPSSQNIHLPAINLAPRNGSLHGGFPAQASTTPLADDPFRETKIMALQRKQRSDTFLNSLTDDQRFQLMEWISQIENLSEIRRRVIAPPPEGFGLQVHVTTIRRIRDQFHASDIASSTDSMMDLISDLEKETDLSQSARVQTVINHLLHEKAFELSRTHPGSIVLKDVLTSIQKLSELDYKRQKLQLERQRLLRHNISPAPQHHHVELNIVPPNQPKPSEPRHPVDIISTPPLPQSTS